MTATASRLPRWIAARNALLARFEQGDWPPGVQLPPEPELAAELGVSRSSLREALRSLSEDGYIDRKPGAGTRVANKPIVTTSLDNNMGIASLIRSMGMVPGIRSTKFRRAEAPEDVARDLELHDERQVAIIERVRTADGKPVTYSRHFYPAPGHIWNENTTLKGSDGPYMLVEARAGISMNYAKVTVSPAIADVTLASRLATSTGALLMHFWQIGFDVDRRPVILSSEYYRADAFEFTILRRGPRSDWQAHAEKA